MEEEEDLIKLMCD